MVEEKFYKRDGTRASKTQFLSESKKANRTIATYIHDDKVDRKLIVHAYYSGIDHGADSDGNPMIYEVTINGDSVAHEKYVGNKWTFHTQAEAAAKYADVVDIIKAGGNL